MTNKIKKLMLNWEEYLIREYQWWWQPGANTVWYRPLEEDLNDYSWNNNDFTLKTWSVTYWTTSWGWKYTYFDTNTWTNFLTFSMDFTKPFTFSFFLNPRQNFTSWNHVVIDVWGQSGLDLSMRTSIEDDNFMIYERIIRNDNILYPVTIENWYYMTIVSDATYVSLYVNWVLYHSSAIHTDSKISWTAKFSIAQVWDTNSTNFSNDMYIARLIYEKEKWWTQQEISDYFNQTKSLYGIS